MGKHISKRLPFALRNSRVRFPFLRKLILLAENDPREEAEIAHDAGIHRKMFNELRRGNDPKATTLVFIGLALGYELVWRKKK